MTVLSLITTRSGKGSPLSHTEMDTNFTSLANAIDEAIGEGKKIIFFETSAPTGWTQDTTATLSNAGLRVVTGTGAGTGGTDEVWAGSLTTTDGHQLTIAEMPSHSHGGAKRGGLLAENGSATYPAAGTSTDATGGDGEHSHDITWDPKYVDVIVCSKDNYT